MKQEEFVLSGKPQPRILKEKEIENKKRLWASYINLRELIH